MDIKQVIGTIPSNDHPPTRSEIEEILVKTRGMILDYCKLCGSIILYEEQDYCSKCRKEKLAF